ncbi:MAG: N-methylhydantoinase A [Acidimicrobiales bacterium]|jgi:N-methylhydantoinase A
MLRLAIDTGGTFTDCVLQDDETGASWFWKTLSTPAEPEQALLDGIDGLQTLRAFESADLRSVLLATTIATNAILERKGARTALVTTAGFRDVLLMGRAKRYDTFDLHLSKPEPLVPRRRVLEVAERVGPDGEVVDELTSAEVDALVARLGNLAAADDDGAEPDSVAVCLLHSYVNPLHEQMIGRAITAWRPDLPVSLSSEVSPKYREYERMSTTVANAYVAPGAGQFLDRLEAALDGRGFSGDLYVMQSNGGLLSTALSRQFPVNMIESGPAAGVLLAADIGRREGIDRVLSFDMGGTTAKLGAVEDGEPAIGTTFEVDAVNQRPGSGLPLNIAAVELVEIGAGGGSIASVDLGLIRVGPESAGAEPGPVCYGRGGQQVTISDANLVLGYLDPDRFAGGRMSLDVDAARAAVQSQIAEPLGLTVLEAAWGVHTVANATMERAMRSMSIDRGRDPRDYALVAFGGAGPIHACRLARALGVRRVIVPNGAGVGSALGMLEAEPQVMVSLTNPMLLTPEATTDASVAECFERLERNASEASGASESSEMRRHAYLRYAGQGYELRVELPEGPIGSGYTAAVTSRFHRVYEDEYGYSEPESTVEAIDWSLMVTLAGATERPKAVVDLDAGMQQPARGSASQASVPVPAAVRKASFPDGTGSSASVVDCPFYERSGLDAGSTVVGPAVIADPEATILIPPGDQACLDEAGHITIEIQAVGIQPVEIEAVEIEAVEIESAAERGGST